MNFRPATQIQTEELDMGSPDKYRPFTARNAAAADDR